VVNGSGFPVLAQLPPILVRLPALSYSYVRSPSNVVPFCLYGSGGRRVAIDCRLSRPVCSSLAFHHGAFQKNLSTRQSQLVFRQQFGNTALAQSIDDRCRDHYHSAYLAVISRGTLPQ